MNKELGNLAKLREERQRFQETSVGLTKHKITDEAVHSANVYYDNQQLGNLAKLREEGRRGQRFKKTGCAGLTLEKNTDEDLLSTCEESDASSCMDSEQSSGDEIDDEDHECYHDEALERMTRMYKVAIEVGIGRQEARILVCATLGQEHRFEVLIERLTDPTQHRPGPSHQNAQCPVCLDLLETELQGRIVVFDCGHRGCLSCVAEALNFFRSSSTTSNHIFRPLPCFMETECCGALFLNEVKRVLSEPANDSASSEDSDTTLRSGVWTWYAQALEDFLVRTAFVPCANPRCSARLDITPELAPASSTPPPPTVPAPTTFASGAAALLFPAEGRGERGQRGVVACGRCLDETCYDPAPPLPPAAGEGGRQGRFWRAVRGCGGRSHDPLSCHDNHVLAGLAAEADQAARRAQAAADADRRRAAAASSGQGVTGREVLAVSARRREGYWRERMQLRGRLDHGRWGGYDGPWGDVLGRLEANLRAAILRRAQEVFLREPVAAAAAGDAGELGGGEDDGGAEDWLAGTLEAERGRLDPSLLAACAHVSIPPPPPRRAAASEPLPSGPELARLLERCGMPQEAAALRDLMAAGPTGVDAGDAGLPPEGGGAEAASEVLVARVSKTCPSPACLAAIAKDGGCNHVRCSHCGMDFCWACSRPGVRCSDCPGLPDAGVGKRKGGGEGHAKRGQEEDPAERRRKLFDEGASQRFLAEGRAAARHPAAAALLDFAGRFPLPRDGGGGLAAAAATPGHAERAELGRAVASLGEAAGMVERVSRWVNGARRAAAQSPPAAAAAAGLEGWDGGEYELASEAAAEEVRLERSAGARGLLTQAARRRGLVGEAAAEAVELAAPLLLARWEAEDTAREAAAAATESSTPTMATKVATMATKVVTMVTKVAMMATKVVAEAAVGAAAAPAAAATTTAEMAAEGAVEATPTGGGGGGGTAAAVVAAADTANATREAQPMSAEQQAQAALDHVVAQLREEARRRRRDALLAAAAARGGGGDGADGDALALADAAHRLCAREARRAEALVAAWEKLAGRGGEREQATRRLLRELALRWRLAADVALAALGAAAGLGLGSQPLPLLLAEPAQPLRQASARLDALGMRPALASLGLLGAAGGDGAGGVEEGVLGEEERELEYAAEACGGSRAAQARELLEAARALPTVADAEAAAAAAAGRLWDTEGFRLGAAEAALREDRMALCCVAAGGGR